MSVERRGSACFSVSVGRACGPKVNPPSGSWYTGLLTPPQQGVCVCVCVCVYVLCSGCTYLYAYELTRLRNPAEPTEMWATGDDGLLTAQPISVESTDKTTFLPTVILSLFLSSPHPV